MSMKISTLIWLLAAAIVIAAMVGYYLWTAESKSYTRHGLVTGISYSEENASAVVDDKIVHAGDTIFGVKVVKIYTDKVEFEKDGKSWFQKTQEEPSRVWPKAD